MSQKVIEMNCPGCGARVTTDQKICEWCRKPIIISTFNSVYTMPLPEINKYAGAYRKALAQAPDNQELNNSAAMCYLKLGLYDKALAAFEKAMEDNFDNSETFFYAAVCLLQEKKAFVQQRPVIDMILEYMNAAMMIEPRGIYCYFLAYIKYDYFERKNLNTSPSYSEMLKSAVDSGLSDYDIEQLYGVLKVPRPSVL